MAVADDDVARVRAATDLVALVGEHAALRQQGRRWVGLCPFHPEKTPSFSVNPEAGLYYCFGCQASGDAITFVRAVEHLDFVDAVRLLADRAGIAIHEDPESGRDRRRRAALFDALERAVTWYHERLLAAPDAGRARDYLRSRGYDGQTVRQFRLGWAPDDWDAFSRASGLPDRVLADAGLAFVNRRGRLQDSFRGRVLFPICDPSGRPVALGGRVLPGAEGRGGAAEPKYKNSPETAIYAKRRTLYGLNWAKHDVVASGEVVVCEGYTDVIGCFQAGVPRAVATCGTSLAEEHFTLLRNFARRVVLAYDADRAGQSAVSRVYEWERRHEVDVAVAALPADADPADLARSDPEALRRAIAHARPFLQFRVERVWEGADLSTAEGRARAADAALAAVAEHPDDLVRDQYVMQVADRCRLDPTLVRQRLEHARRRPVPPPSRDRMPRHRLRAGMSGPDDQPAGPRDRPVGRGSRQSAPEGSRRDASGSGRTRPARRPAKAGSRPGLEALRLAVHRPEAVAHRLEACLFTDEVQRQAFEALAAAENLHEAIESAGEEAAELLRRVAVEEPLANDGFLGDPVDAVVHQLVREATRRELARLQAEARVRGAELSSAAAETARLRLWVEELDDPQTCHLAGERLLAWLIARGESG
ncbi:MAG TPA: DNA primase [Acidimicrobiales bacterium]|nr:DNA primase [Acidimicrobiales bacterium]